MTHTASKRAIGIVLGVGVMLAVPACTADRGGPAVPSAPPPGVSASPAPPDRDPGGADDCAEEIDANPQTVLPIDRLRSLGTTVAFSSRAERYSGPGCRRVDPVMPRECTVAAFPWVTSPTTTARDLVSRGVSSTVSAQYRVDDTAVLTEMVLRAAPGSPLAETYRSHLTGCGATVLEEEGRPTRFGLGASDELAVAVSDTVVVALISRDSRVSATSLLDEAVQLAG